MDRPEVAAPPQFSLRFISGKYTGGEFPLQAGREIVIGRSSELDMVLAEEFVARRHARVIVASDGTVEIEDLSSTNGTFVNGEKIRRQRLKEGDRVLIGTSIMKLVRVQTAPDPGMRLTPAAPAVATQDRGPRTIFVSYRREDSADITGRIWDRLVARFGRESIFKDVDSVPLGVDFKRHIEGQVHRCVALLAVIGKGWLDARDDRGRRLDRATDFVRLEIEAALARDIPVIPILVQNASMPEPDDLPATLAPLALRNGTFVRSDPDFHRDMDRIVGHLEDLLGPQHA